MFRKFRLMRFIQTLLFLLLTTSIIAQSASYVGTWEGEIKLSEAGRLSVIFTIDGTGKSMTCSMQVPQQGEAEVAAESISFENNHVVINYPNLRASYAGKLVGENIEGNWSQNGMTFPLELAPYLKDKAPDRPQHPMAPFNYDISEIEVDIQNKNSSHKLSGTLTQPKGDGPFPLAIMVSGSGPQDRDETIFHHKPFWVIADYLTNNGIAVYRYDERGVGKSTGSFANCTTQEFTEDALAVVGHLSKMSQIDSEKVGIIGHSEGALVASMAAAKSKDIKFAILLAGPAVPGHQLLKRQIRDVSLAEGIAPEKIQKESQIKSDIINIAAGAGNAKERSSKAKQKLKSFYDSNFSAAEKKEKGDFEQYFNTEAGPLFNPWMHFFLNIEPKKYIEKMACPTLALIGSKDMQVSADDNISAFRAALHAAPTEVYKVKEIEGVNHLFQHSRTGKPSEYGTLGETFAHEVLVMMRDWLKSI